MLNLKTVAENFLQSQLGAAYDASITLLDLIIDEPEDYNTRDSQLYILDLRRFHPERELPGAKP